MNWRREEARMHSFENPPHHSYDTYDSILRDDAGKSQYLLLMPDNPVPGRVRERFGDPALLEQPIRSRPYDADC